MGEQSGGNGKFTPVVPPLPSVEGLSKEDLFPMLTDAQCRNATCSPGAKRERYADSGGLYLEVSPAGSRRWFWKYRKDGSEKRLALGS